MRYRSNSKSRARASEWLILFTVLSGLMVFSSSSSTKPILTPDLRTPDKTARPESGTSTSPLAKRKRSNQNSNETIATFAPVADAYVSSTATSSNFGTASELRSRRSTLESYLRFDLFSLDDDETILSAKLRIRGQLSDTSGTNVTAQIFSVSNSSWTETAITWSNKPSSGSTALASVTVTDNLSRLYEWDVTTFVRAELNAERHLINLALKNPSTSSPYATFNSREAASNPPELVITTTPPPTVGISSPTSGASFLTPATITIDADAADSNGIMKVEFLRGTTLLGTDTTFPYSFTWTNPALGNYTLTARATDNLGAVTTSAPVDVSVVLTLPPTVNITSPVSGTTFPSPASMTITANASDTNGIAKVDFYQGATLIGTSTAPPYSFTWTGMPSCSYSLTARATDSLGATATSLPVLVRVGSAEIGEPTPTNFKIAFLADQSLGPLPVAALNLVESEGAQALVISGDLDYADNPAAWDAQLNDTVGPNFPVFTLAGNHDEDRWHGPTGYQKFIEDRFNRLGIPWCGSCGVQSSFHYKGIFFVFTTPGLDPIVDLGNNDTYIREQLAADHSVWSISSWHKNMRLMQAGGKSDETGWEVYEESRAGGAIIANGHEHSYFRTHLLSSMMNQTVASTANTFTLTKGNSFVFVAGLGGDSRRDQEITGPWVARIYATPCLPGDPICQPNAVEGAMFGVFNVDGQQNKANFYFKDVNGQIIDSFTVISEVDMPSITNISPSEAVWSGEGLTLTVQGTNFLNEAVVMINGAARATTFVSSTQLTAQITATDLLSGGLLPVTVFNAVTGGGRSNPVNFTVASPIPSIATLSPTAATRGSGDFTLTVNGTNFAGNAVVRFNGSDQLTSFVSNTQLSALIPSSSIATAGTFMVTVVNPQPGGGSSNAVDFAVSNPTPLLDSISPTNKTAGDAAFTLTVNGASFVNDSVVRLNGNDRATTFVSTTQLTAQILATDIQSAGTFPITVHNPVPAGGTSSALDLTVNNPVPTIGSLEPASATAGDAAFTLAVNGAGFVDGAVVKWNGTDRPTNFVSSTQLLAQLTGAEVASAGTFLITVINPVPGGGSSPGVDFTVHNPLPVVSNLSPATVTAGNPSLSLTVNGSNFVSASVVRFEGQERVTNFGNPNQLTVELTAADLQDAGTFHIAVFNPGPGGGLSNVTDFTVGGPNPVPTISALSPDSQVAGGAAFALTVNGSKFVSGSVVRLNGNDRLTSFVSTTQLTAQITAADIASGGIFPITVFNPAEGGGTSNAVSLNVNHPTPAISTLSPGNTMAGSADFTLTINGSNFVSGTVLKWNGSDRPTNVVSSTQLTAQITAPDVASATTVPITVVNPAPGGGPSNAINFIVNNPIPVLDNIAPTSAMSGDLPFALTINGSNFVAGSVVRFENNDRPTSFISSTQLTASIMSADLLNAGTFHITVFNPGPGGGVSNVIDLFVAGPNPVPVISVLSPASVTAGGADFTLTVRGANFVNGSLVRFNNNDKATTFVSSTELAAQITAADIVTAGAFPLTVFNPAPGGGQSSALTFNVNNPAPALTSISPTNRAAGSGAFTLMVSGSGFISTSVVRFNGSDRPTTFVDATQLTAQISATDLQTAGTFSITAFNPAPGGGTSPALNLIVDNPAPALTSISPSSATSGGATFTLTVNGTGFVNGSIVQVNGSNRTTTFVNSTRLTAQIVATDLTTAGSLPITILNPLPGGGSSNPIALLVNNPAPSLTSLSPTNTLAGGAAFVLTVNGNNFVNSSVVTFKGNARTTTFVSATRLTAEISAEDIATAGPASVTVFNSAPGGGTSSSLNFTVNNRVPTVSNVLPASANVGAPPLTLTVNGSNFVSGSVVRFSGSNRVTTFVSATQITAQLLSTDSQTAGFFPITVQNPTPGGGTSSAFSFTVNNLAPTIGTLSPNNVLAGEQAFTLTVNGADFVNGSVVKFDGVPRATTLVSSNQLKAQILATDVQTAGTRAVMVLNPAPGGGASAPGSLTINNPAPTLSTISPANVVLGGGAFTLTVNGTNFNSSSVVNLNGLTRATTFVSSTQLTAQILATDIATIATLQITVFNPLPGGGMSEPTSLAVNNPMPVFTELVPTSTVAGGVGFTLTVNGTGFVDSSIVSFNGANRPTSFVNANQLTAQITAADIQTAGAFPITVINPAPGGGTSAPGSFLVNFPVPSLSSLNPTSTIVGGAAFTLTITGTNFVNGSIARLNGSDRATVFVSSSQLNVTVTAADIATVGSLSVTVVNPTPGGGLSNPLTFSIDHPAPVISNLSPSATIAGATGFTLNVNGSAFLPTSVVHWNGQTRATTVISDTQVSAQILDDDISAPGTASVTVVNPTPGGGPSNATPFVVGDNPRRVQVVNSSGAPGSLVSVPILLAAQGDENALSFSVTFDSTLLNNPQTTLGSDAAGATLNTDISQVAQGRLGIAVSLPSGQTFAAGTRQIVVVAFTLADPGLQASTQIGLGTEPTARQVSDVNGARLPSIYSAGILTMFVGYEGDIAPRPNGSNNGSVSIADWVLAGRFVAGLDPISCGSEFQRVDSAPRATLGSGSLTIADWVQAGRYAAGIDPVVPVGGPTCESPSAPEISGKAGIVVGPETGAPRSVRIMTAKTKTGRTATTSVILDSSGDENAIGFTLNFSTSALGFIAVSKGPDAGDASIAVNLDGVAKGEVGIALALPPGKTFVPGERRLIVTTFKLLTNDKRLAIGFGDQLIKPELVDAEARKLITDFVPGMPGAKRGKRSNPLDEARFFVHQQYLDVFGRLPDPEGLDYWTNQITVCGADQDCVENKRMAVSAAFFFEREFNETAFFIYQLYKYSLGRPPTYAEFVAERKELAGLAGKEKARELFLAQWTARKAFLAAYSSVLTRQEFVNKLFDAAGHNLEPSERRRQVTAIAKPHITRSEILLEVIENSALNARDYNGAFVTIQYFAYLQRDPDPEGHSFWLDLLNREPGHDGRNKYHAVICAFITSSEYQLRFGEVTRSNSLCDNTR